MPLTFMKLGKYTYPGLGTDRYLVFGHDCEKCEGGYDEKKIDTMNLFTALLLYAIAVVYNL